MLAARVQSVKRAKPPTHDHDGSAKRQLARLTGKDAWAGKQSARLAGRAGRAETERAGIPVRKQYVMGFWVHVGERSRRNRVLAVPAGAIDVGGARRLCFPDLRMGPSNRVALVGANGLGKSTLVRHLLTQVNVPPERLVYVSQEITATESRRIMDDVSELSREELGKVMTSVSRLGSRPGRLIESAQPSPGEIRTILLALGVVRGPHLIVMDEPTNHMDLPSIACVEESLADCPCALLLVSHDLRFLDALVEWRWQLETASAETVRLSIAPWRARQILGCADRYDPGCVAGLGRTGRIGPSASGVVRYDLAPLLGHFRCCRAIVRALRPGRSARAMDGRACHGGIAQRS